MNSILGKLKGGDRRSLGQADEIARQIAADTRMFSKAFDAMLCLDPVIRMRAADAIEKATREHPELLRPYKLKLLKKVAAIHQQEVRWHVAQMLPRLKLTAKEQELAVAILFDYLEDKSSIVRTFAMQALADLALADHGLRARVVPLLEFLTNTGSPAMRSRGRKLLAKLRKEPLPHGAR
jgi:HEAT repeat protein